MVFINLVLLAIALVLLVPIAVLGIECIAALLSPRSKPVAAGEPLPNFTVLMQSDSLNPDSTPLPETQSTSNPLASIDLS